MAEHVAGSRKGPAHARHHGLTKESEKRLSELGRRLPPPSPEDLEVLAADRRALRRRHLIVGVFVTLLVLVVVGAGVQWFRPLPAAEFQSAVSTSVQLPGTVPALPWPTQGAAALAVEGVGSFGQVRGTAPVPIAGVADVLAAFVVLHDHPLSPQGDGPPIAVTPQTVASYQTGSAQQEAEVPVAAGETLSERQALEGLLVASGNDMAVLLADWDAGSTAAFVTKMNDAARILGLRSTHVADPSGLDPHTVSTPLDLIRLGEVALGMPAFGPIVALGETTLPDGRLAYNPNFDLGRDGIVGIKTGASAAAHGCYLFAAQRVVNGRTVTVVGAVLGQVGPSPDTAAVNAGDLLDKAALSFLGEMPLLSPGQVVGQLVTQWGAFTSVTASNATSVVGWPGLKVPIEARVEELRPPTPKGVRVGTLSVRGTGHRPGITMRTAHALAGPSAFWRLTRF
jgi:D-alanyl-D-alanine carboxypeptidase (penicillin-binding protein 5/6)